MTAPWSYAGAPPALSSSEVVVMEGTTFCTSDSGGDVGTHLTSGLFVRDTRVLSSWRLVLRHRRLEPLRVHHEGPYSAHFVLHSPGPGPGDADLLVTRERFVGEGLREDVTIRNVTGSPTLVLLDLEVDADFADLFEVKERRDRPVPVVDSRVVGEGLELHAVRDGLEYAVTVEADPVPLVVGRALHWAVTLEGHAAWTASVLVTPRLRGRTLVPHHQPGSPAEHAEPARRHRLFRSNAPRLSTPDAGLVELLGRSVDDLGTLRIFQPERPELPVIAAGAPWFMALFGRDSLITSMMLMPVDRDLARGTLTTLASYLGERHDAATEEQPGRVPHEVRFGPTGTLALGGGNVYYGSADATPLFVMALGELLRWEPDLVTPELVAAADRALDWILTSGDPDGDGFVEYARMNERGLVNQGWKDSWDGVNFADGSVPEAPIALAEVQGYVYAAYLARAGLADAAGEPSVAARWRERAARLKVAFNRAFWLPDRGWYAVALDGDKRPVDALTSNNGHCLWTGIADDAKAARVAAHLLSPAMFSGWGIRTLAEGMGAYNPMSYHNGSVWPHDTAICVAGLVRYGHVVEAQEVALGLLDAAASFGGRLPELFTGFARAELPVPVPYPAACSPQAWSAAAPVELLRALLGLEPGPDGLACRPAVPDRLLPIQLHHVSFRGQRLDIDVDRDGSRVQAAPGLLS